MPAPPRWAAGGPARCRLSARRLAVRREPTLALSVEIAEVRPRDDHPVEDRFQLGVSLLADGGNLALVAVAAGLLDQEGSERPDVSRAQDGAKPRDVGAVVRGHRWRSAVQVGSGPVGIGAGQAEEAGASSGVSVSRSPPPMLPTRL